MKWSKLIILHTVFIATSCTMQAAKEANLNVSSGEVITTFVECAPPGSTIKPVDATVSQEALAGVYASVPGLSGRRLYLFPNKSYMFFRWADIYPLTLEGKGKWEFSNGCINLQTYRGSGIAPIDTTYIPFHYAKRNEPRTIALAGYPKAFSLVKDRMNKRKEKHGERHELDLLFANVFDSFFSYTRESLLDDRAAIAAARKEISKRSR